MKVRDGITAAALVLLAAGCGGTPSPSEVPSTAPAGSVPTRPVVLSLDSVNPCSLLTADQRTQLKVRAGTQDTDTSGPLQGPSCTWFSVAQHPADGYDGTVVLNHGADFARGGDLVMVDGFGALTTTSLGSDPNYFCGLLVDVASGQSLSAIYSNNAHDYPGMNRQLACSKAQQLASAMLATLRAQVHK